MSDIPERSAGIKRLEKKKGRLWGILSRVAPGTVEPLSPVGMTQRLRHIMMSSIKTTGSFLRSRMGEMGLKNMFEHQAEEFASSAMRPHIRADLLAKNTIRFNFQPLGMEASYSGDAESARILVERCPLPQRFLDKPEFLEQLTFEQRPLLEGFQADTLTARGEWPPKKVESCSVCRIVMPRVGEKLGFEWTGGLTGDAPPKCFFTISVKPEE